GDPRLLGFGQADPEVEPERCSELVGEEGAERPAGDPPDDLPEDPAVGAEVVAVPRARLPDRRLSRGCGDHRAPRQHLLQGERRVDDWDAGAVAEDPGERGT